MGTHFQMLVDQDVRIEDANDLLAQVLRQYRDDGLIMGEANADCALGGAGYRPGPAIPDVYELRESEVPLWELRTCGITPRVGRAFNYWACGPSFEGCSCPVCSSEYDAYEQAIALIRDAIGQWVQESGPALVRCAFCGNEVPITEWLWTPPLGFGNLSFTFWNWPSFRSPGWRISLQEITERVTGRKLVYTYGKF